MEQKHEGKILIKVAAVYLIVFAVIYLILGNIAMIAQVDLFGVIYNDGSRLVMVLAFGTAIAAFIIALVGLKTAKGAMDIRVCEILGIILVLLGITSLIYIQLTQHEFNFFDMGVLVCGIFYIVGSRKISSI